MKKNRWIFATFPYFSIKTCCYFILANAHVLFIDSVGYHTAEISRRMLLYFITKDLGLLGKVYFRSNLIMVFCDN